MQGVTGEGNSATDNHVTPGGEGKQAVDKHQAKGNSVQNMADGKDGQGKKKKTAKKGPKGGGEKKDNQSGNHAENPLKSSSEHQNTDHGAATRSSEPEVKMAWKKKEEVPNSTTGVRLFTRSVSHR